MLPTLRVGDHFIATKSPYLEQGPQGGDVVVFWIARGDIGIFPVAERPDLARDRFIKRVIGIPGDRIEIRGAAVYVNGAALPQSKVGEISDSDGILEVFSESRGGVEYTIALDPTVDRQHLPEVLVPPDEYFVMGDNRDHSNDSRIWGTIHRRDVIGKASHLYFSQDPAGGGPQWRRIGLRVE
jgi:signal peptidase I